MCKRYTAVGVSYAIAICLLLLLRCLCNYFIIHNVCVLTIVMTSKKKEENNLDEINVLVRFAYAKYSLCKFTYCRSSVFVILGMHDL